MSSVWFTLIDVAKDYFITKLFNRDILQHHILITNSCALIIIYS